MINIDINFFKLQMDYIFFLHGLSFFILGFICFFLARLEGRRFSWTWLWLFGLFHGINEWPNLLLIAAQESLILNILRSFLLLISFIFLFEFGRQGIESRNFKKILAGFYPLFLAFIFLGSLKGSVGFDAALRYSFGFIGGLLSARALFFKSKTNNDKGFWLLSSSLAMVFYAFSAGLIMPWAAFFPASLINSNSFSKTFGFPVELFRTLCISLIAVFLWFYYQGLRYERFKGYQLQYRTAIRFISITLLFFILFSGWLLVNLAGKHTEKNLRDNLLLRTKIIGAAFSPDKLKNLSGTYSDITNADYQFLKGQLDAMGKINKDCQYIYLMASKNNKIIFLLDSKPESSPDYSPPGEIYPEATLGLRMSFINGQEFVEGPVSERRGTWVSAIVPIKDIESRKVIAITGMDVDASSWARAIAIQRLNFIGIILFMSGLVIVFFIAMQWSEDVNYRVRLSEERLHQITDNMLDLICQVDIRGVFYYASPSYRSLLGYKPSGLLGSSVFEFVHPDEIENVKAIFASSVQTRSIGRVEFRYRHANGHYIWLESMGSPIFDEYGRISGAVISSRAIDERKFAEQKNQLALKIFAILNSSVSSKKEIISGILRHIKDFTGFQAVGIRLRENDDFPYFVTNGFADNFIEKEKYLCSRDSSGNIILDSEGNVYLECMCGNVIAGRADPSLPFFTQNGSFWTNSTTKLLASTSDKDQLTRIRNRCNSEGYETVALIPLRSGKEIIGLLQLNDPREDLLKPELLHFLEAVAISIAIALERKSIEEALRITQFSIDRTVNLVFWIDNEGKILYANDSACSSLEYFKQELLTKNVSEIAPELPAEVWSERWQEVKKRSYFIFESALRTKNKKFFPVEIILNYLEYEGKEYNFAFVTDISERKRAESMLRADEERFRDLFDNMSSGVAVYEVKQNAQDFIFKDFNRAAERIDSLKKEFVVGKSFLEIFPQAKEFGIFDVLRRVYLSGEPEYFPVTFYQDQRISGWREIYVYKLSSQEVVSIYDDVTERKRTEDSLRENEEKYRSLIESTPYSVSIQAEDKIVYVNNSGVKLWGARGQEDLLGKSIFDLVHPDYHEAIKNLRKQILESALRPEALEFKGIRLDGKIIDIEVIGTHISFQGKTAIQTIMRDITERKIQEEALDKAYTDLKKAQDSLIQSEKLAALGRFSSGMAHEIKNPLGIILGGIEFLERKFSKADKSSKIAIKKIKESTLRADTLMRSLLKFSRPTEIKAERLNVSDLIKGVIVSIKYKIDFTRVKIETKFSEEDIYIEVDRDKIEQVIINIILNSLESIPKTGMIKIKTSKAEYKKISELPVCLLEIIDTGVGMTKENLSRIFEPFFTTKLDSGGTGLGLSIAKSIIELHRGAILVESEYGQGTQVRIYLPLAKDT